MKILKVVLVTLLLLTISACGAFAECEPKDGKICYQKKSKTYILENDARLIVAVSSEAMGEALVSMWNTYFPENEGVVRYEVLENRTALYYYNNQRYDLIYINSTQIPMIMDKVATIDENTVKAIKPYTVDKFAELVNQENYIFTPLVYDGFLFAYDQTMLERLNISLTDDNNDGLPDSIDSWEKIFSRITAYEQGTIKGNFKVFFPLAFNEKHSFYAMLTAGGWQMFDQLQAEKPGFDSIEFQRSLNFIYDLGKYEWQQNTKLSSDELLFRYEEVLVKQTAPLTMISTWMYFDEYQQTNGSDYHFAKMPSYNNNTLTPLVSIDGYAINTATSYPNAANQFIQLLRSKEGLQYMIDHTDLSLVINLEVNDDILISDNTRYEKIRAYAYSVEEPIIALANNSTVRAWQMYYEIDWLSIVKQLYDHEITVSEAQKSIIDMANDWLIAMGEIKE
ncbi:MAG: extracellular solute-binding protein [Erysipelotrichaceae bacterium]|nr:extracellular solute-binding protein [Erysipelotrichaceae bacterium]